MTYTLFYQNFDNGNGVNEVLSLFVSVNLMARVQDITQNVLCIQLTLRIAISTWSLLLSYIDDTLSVYCAICY